MAMVTDLLLFLFTGATLTLLLWTSIELFRAQEDPLSDRLEGLQSQAMVVAARASRRKKSAQGLDRFLYIIALFPGGEDWMNGTEKLLAQAAIRRKSALALYCIFVLLFVFTLAAGTVYLQRNNPNPATSLLGGLVAAFLLGFLLPKQILYRLVKRYRAKLQEALPDTVDLLGIVLGTGLGLDQAMMRVSEEMQYIYPELANEFATVVMQVRAGQERAKSFNQFVRRTGIEDIKSLAAMIRRRAAHAAPAEGGSGGGQGGDQDAVPDRDIHPAGAVRDHAGAGHAERAERFEDAGRRAVRGGGG